MQRDSRGSTAEGAKRKAEKKQWVKPSATTEEVAKVTKASNHNFVKSDGTTCQS